MVGGWRAAFCLARAGRWRRLDAGAADRSGEHRGHRPRIRSCRIPKWSMSRASSGRRRHVAGFLGGGKSSGIWKSADNGKTWRQVKTGLQGDMGKIGLAVSAADPALVYATIEANEEERGFYRSRDRGESWEKRNSYISGGTGPQYYQEIEASPSNADLVYQMDVFSASPAMVAPASRSSRPGATNIATTTLCGSTRRMAIICSGAPTAAFTRASMRARPGAIYRICPSRSSTRWRPTTASLSTTWWPERRISAPSSAPRGR